MLCVCVCGGGPLLSQACGKKVSLRVCSCLLLGRKIRSPGRAENQLLHPAARQAGSPTGLCFGTEDGCVINPALLLGRDFRDTFLSCPPQQPAPPVASTTAKGNLSLL